MFQTRFLRIAAALFALATIGVAGASDHPLQIEPARTRVGLARVLLEIRDLVLVEGELRGVYEVKVPLAPMMNDRGRIEIGLDSPLSRVMSERGTVVGSGHSLLDGRTHPVTCEFGPDRSVSITIDTGDRVLAFKTRYR